MRETIEALREAAAAMVFFCVTGAALLIFAATLIGVIQW